MEFMTAKNITSLEYKKYYPITMLCGAESIILSAVGAESMMLSARVESIILSAPPAESMMLLACDESIFLSAPLAESMMLSAWYAPVLPLKARSCVGGAESITLSVGGAESITLS